MFGKILILDADIWSCLYRVNVLFLGVCCPFWFLGECGSYVLPGIKFSWDPARCGHCRCQVKCVSNCWEQMLRNEDGLEEDGGGPQEEGKQGVPLGLM